MIDFLFVHLRICGKVTSVKGVGIEILRAVCLIAHALNCKRVWGEATSDSAPFYKRQLNQTVEVHFHIERPQIADMADHLEAERLTS